MERILLVGVVVFVALFGVSGVYAEQLVMVTPSVMNFRTEPSAESEQVSDCPKLYFGAVLEVLDEQSDWYYVEDMYGHKGWARAVYEGNVYLKDLPDDYLETHITAYEAYERAKPFSEEWAYDAYLTQIYTKETGWNGLAEVWNVRFFAPSKKEPVSEENSYPEYFRYLEITVSEWIISSREETGGFAFGGAYIFEPTVEPTGEAILDSDELFAPSRMAEYHELSLTVFLNGEELPFDWFLSGNSSMLDHYDNNWIIVSPGPYGIPFIVLDSQTGVIIDVFD